LLHDPHLGDAVQRAAYFIKSSSGGASGNWILDPAGVNAGVLLNPL
jgi:hypothetical protein